MEATLENLKDPEKYQALVIELRQRRYESLKAKGVDVDRMMAAKEKFGDIDNPCPKCFGPRGRERGYCLSCHAAYANEKRPKYADLTDEQRKKANARAYVNAYQRRGKVKDGVCEHCGTDKNLEKHHHDYSKPLEITWLCRGCHRQHHRKQS